MSSLRRFAAAACLLLAAPALRAQQLPTPDQARRLLETRPDLAGQIRREIGSSGLTQAELLPVQPAAASAPPAPSASGEDLLPGIVPPLPAAS